jgi:hypothetical protein
MIIGSRSGTEEKQSQPESEMSGSLAEGCESAGNKPPRLESRGSESSSSGALPVTVGFEA